MDFYGDNGFSVLSFGLRLMYNSSREGGDLWDDTMNPKSIGWIHIQYFGIRRLSLYIDLEKTKRLL